MKSSRRALVLFALACVACKRAPAPADREAGAPMRIVSIGSSVTETVFALGAGDRVVGVDTSRACIGAPVFLVLLVRERRRVV